MSAERQTKKATLRALPFHKGLISISAEVLLL